MTGDDDEECGALSPEEDCGVLTEEESASNAKCFTLQDFQEFVEVDLGDPREEEEDWAEEGDEVCAVCDQAEEEFVTPVRNASGWQAVDRSTPMSDLFDTPKSAITASTPMQDIMPAVKAHVSHQSLYPG